MLTLDGVKVLLVFLALGLLIYAVIDCSRTPDAAVPAALPRSGWFVLMILLPILGPLFWLLASRTEGDGRNTGPRPGPTGGAGRGRSNPRGPDDDPDFLHGL